MSNRLGAICMAVALALFTGAADVSAKGLAVSAKGGSATVKGFGKISPHMIRHHHRFGYGQYGGVFVAGQTKAEFVAPPQPASPVIQAAYALKCTTSEEVKVVPSEEGGSREIKVRRC